MYQQEAIKETSPEAGVDRFSFVSSTVMASKEVLSCDLGGEVVLLDMKSGVYFGLDAIGSRIWELIQAPILVSDICAVLRHEYLVEPLQCEADTCVFLNGLASNGLLQFLE